MSTVILIYIITSLNGSNVTTHTQEFNSTISCQKAIGTLVEMEQKGFVIKARCLNK